MSTFGASMADALAEYACDACRFRKITCSKVRSGCDRCASRNLTCAYSRSGIIRRKRKRKSDRKEEESTPSHSVAANPGRYETGADSYLAPDIDITRERLRGIDNSQHNSLGALSSLSEACAAVWHDDAAAQFGRTGRDFFLLEDRMGEWVDAFLALIDRGQPLLFPAPAAVIEHLRECSPQSVQDGAWLVMFYSIILSHISSTTPTDESTKGKLRCNLWLSLNDVRLLLEPSEANIQALIILASHVEEFTTPSLSWMLTSNACRMLQALGVNRRGLDERTKERRRLTFWHLNLLDKGLAMIFGRAPTFHRAMCREIPLPSMEQLLSCQPHLRPTESGSGRNFPSTFGAHYFYQVMTLTRILADIWHVVYEEDDVSTVHRVNEELETWYKGAKQILEAAAMTEKPFLDAAACRSIDLGLQMLDFNHSYLVILLSRHSDQTDRMRSYCISMLNLLPKLVSDSEEVFNGIVWQILCCPFTPFLALFGEILSREPSIDSVGLLDSMKHLPPFLREMGERNSLARQLEKVATVLMKHASSVVEEHTQTTPADSGIDILDWESLLDVDGDMLASWSDVFGADLDAADWLN